MDTNRMMGLAKVIEIGRAKIANGRGGEELDARTEAKARKALEKIGALAPTETEGDPEMSIAEWAMFGDRPAVTRG